MRPLTIIDAGESLYFSFDRGNNTITNWTCTIYVMDVPGGTVQITRDILAVDGAFSGYLTSAETASLEDGKWWLIAILSKDSTNEQETINRRFKVNKAFVTA